MVEYGKDDERTLDELFQALADPNRRRIVALLREAGELKVGNVAASFEMSLNGVSKHLKVLERAQLIRRRVDGREHWVSVNFQRLQPAYEWLHFYHHYWSQRLDALVDYVELAEGSAKQKKGNKS